MALKPMHDVVFGEPVIQEVKALVSELDQLTAEFDAGASGRLDTELSLNRRQLVAGLDGKKQPFQVTVVGMGPDCQEVELGDILILPAGVGTMITVIDEDTGSAARVYAIRESAVLARFRED